MLNDLSKLPRWTARRIESAGPAKLLQRRKDAIGALFTSHGCEPGRIIKLTRPSQCNVCEERVERAFLVKLRRSTRPKKGMGERVVCVKCADRPVTTIPTPPSIIADVGIAMPDGFRWENGHCLNRQGKCIFCAALNNVESADTPTIEIGEQQT